MAEEDTQAGVGLAGPADPTTVLTSITAGLGQLVLSNGTASEPTTPSESPQSLDSGLRCWLSEALQAANSNPKVYAKLLVSNAAAGSIIGKGGGNINGFQAKTYARIQLSKSQEYYPGTQDRTLLVAGRLKQVIAALSLILSKLMLEGVAPLTPKSRAAAAEEEEEEELEEEGAAAAAAAQDRAPRRLLVKLLVPQPLCGIIIGKNGVTIRQFAADTGTSIRVTSPDGHASNVSHRIVTIGGLQDSVLKAIALMVLKQSEDPKFGQYSELPAEGSSSGGGGHLGAGPYAAGLAWRGEGAGPRYAVPYQTQGGDAYTELSVLLLEEQGMMLFGRDGSGVADVQQVTGVRIHSEPSGELPTGQGLRRVTLAGSIDAVQYAQWMLGQRLAAGLHAATVQMRGGPPGAAAAGLPPGGYFIAAYPAGAAAGMTAPGLAHNHREVVGHGPAAFPVGAHLHAQLAAAVGHGQAQHFAAAAHGPAGGYPRPVQLQAGPQTRSGLAGEEPGHGWGGESGGGGSSRGRWA